jgi:hypothetical protein
MSFYDTGGEGSVRQLTNAAGTVIDSYDSCFPTLAAKTRTRRGWGTRRVRSGFGLGKTY